MKNHDFDPVEYALAFGGNLLGVKNGELDFKTVERIQSLPHALQPRDFSNAYAHKETVHKLGRKLVIVSLATAAVATGVGIYALSRPNRSSAQEAAVSVPMEIGKLAYANSGKLAVYYTKTDGTIAILPDTQTGGSLTIKDSGTVAVSVAWNGDSTAITTKGNEIKVDRNGFSLVATNMTADFPTKSCSKTDVAAGTDSTCPSVVRGAIAENASIGLSSNEATRMTGILSLSASGAYNKNTVTAEVLKVTAASFKTSTFDKCAAPLGAMADAAIRQALQKGEKQVVFAQDTSYVTVGQEYAARAEIKPIVDAPALGVTDVAVVCNDAVAA